jgi:hypothetical protein
MYSKQIKFFIALSGLFPILFIFWLVGILEKWDTLGFYIESDELWNGFEIFMRLHWLLLLFLALIFLCRFMLNYALKILPSKSFDTKSIKPADPNFLSILLSYLAPWFKVFITDNHVGIYITGFLVIAFCLALITSESYQYNLSIRLFFGYKNFEVATKDEVTYLVLSKTPLINKTQVTQVVYLTDYMLINTTP